MFEALMSALYTVFQPFNLFIIFLGCLIGILVGSMPGLSSIMGLSIMMPLTLKMQGESGVLMLLGVFCGAIYGGSITAILIHSPGTANSAATTLDGYPMNLKGEAGRALGISTMASTFGGIFSSIMLFWISPLLSKVALNFGAPEYFALAIFGLSMVTSISAKNIVKGLIGAVLGLIMATIGIDSLTGQSRFTFGTVYLMGGIQMIPVLIALYAFAQGLINIENGCDQEDKGTKQKLNRIFPTLQDVKATLPTMFRSSIIGPIIGAIPGTGGDIACWVGYNEAKRVSKHKELFGKGIPEGVAAPEAANNAISGGALIPLLTLGIPGDAGTAVMLSALMMQGIVPGPLLFQTQGKVVYGIILGMFAANIAMCILGYCGIRIFAKIGDVSNKYLTPIVFAFCVVGTYAVNNNIIDILLMMFLGVIAYILIKLDFPMPPIILGLILGNLAEKNLQRSLVISHGSISIFFTRPISCGFLMIAIISILWPVVKSLISKMKQNNRLKND